MLGINYKVCVSYASVQHGRMGINRGAHTHGSYILTVIMY